MKGGDIIMTVEEAKKMISQENIDRLKNVVAPRPEVNISNKANADIIMAALCTAVTNGKIKEASLNESIIKLLNSSTSTLSAVKVGKILSILRQTQPNMTCVITLKTSDAKEDVKEWVFTGPEVYFNRIFEFVVREFEITPALIRSRLGEMFKMTIVNNVAQLLGKYETLKTDEERKAVPISISTITRLVNMSHHLLFAEFVERDD